MAVLHNGDRWDKSNVLIEDGLLVEYNKHSPNPSMQYIDYGLSLVSSTIFKNKMSGINFDLADLYFELSTSGELSALEVHERFYEVGSHNGLKETEEYFLKKGEDMNYAAQHLKEAVEIIQKMDAFAIEKMADLLSAVKKENGRIFFLGVGGSAGNCSPTDNVSELTARTNDEGWSTVFVEWLKISKLQPKDALFIFSVGGGNMEKNISPNLVEAIKFGKSVGAKITGVVGRDGGYTAQAADACVIVPTVNPDTITPHSEAFQAVVWHLLVSHPKLKANQTKWESAVK
jgi:D-sedoheptulose 7-phosphate isomerase